MRKFVAKTFPTFPNFFVLFLWVKNDVRNEAAKGVDGEKLQPINRRKMSPSFNSVIWNEQETFPLLAPKWFFDNEIVFILPRPGRCFTEKTDEQADADIETGEWIKKVFDELNRILW